MDEDKSLSKENDLLMQVPTARQVIIQEFHEQVEKILKQEKSNDKISKQRMNTIFLEAIDNFHSSTSRKERFLNAKAALAEIKEDLRKAEEEAN